MRRPGPSRRTAMNQGGAVPGFPQKIHVTGHRRLRDAIAAMDEGSTTNLSPGRIVRYCIKTGIMQTRSGSFLPALSAEISSALICETIGSNMYGSLQMRQYQQQSVLTSSPEQLILKHHDLRIAPCRRHARTHAHAGPAAV